MTETLLLAIALLIVLMISRRQDWYVVELRSCDNAKLCEFAFGPDPYRHGLGPKLKVAGFEAEPVTSNFVQLNYKDGGSITINQVVFGHIDAAKTYMHVIDDAAKQESQSNAVRFRYQKVYLWRIVARTRYGAVTVPPSLYSDKDGVILSTLPVDSWYGPSAHL